MSVIRPLPRSVIEAIAAGEVVERPAVVIKELVENAVDAEASFIRVEVEEAGLRKMVVSDDGVGMDAVDVELAVQRHTTSKIHSTADLEQLSTLGFRGEALASIASVSLFTLQSKLATATTGYQIIIENGEILEKGPIGIPSGTTVIVEHLFRALPARLKFLKSKQTELRNIVEVVTALALSHPDKGFFLSHNGKVLLLVPARQTHEDRIAALFGEQLTQQLIPLSFQHDVLQLHGFLGQPQLARRTKHSSFLFVNQRAVSSPMLQRTLKELYGTLLEAKSDPFFVLHLQLSPTQLDVNVHPRKELVRFADEPQVRETLRQLLAPLLSQPDVSYRAPSLEDDLGQLPKGASSVTAEYLKTHVSPWQFEPENEQKEIAQLHRTYLVQQSPNGITLTDQHAAHERILYEQFLAQMQVAASAHTHPLPTPLVLELPLAEAQLLVDHLSALRKLGYEIEPFGTQTFTVTAVPELLKDRPTTQLIRELLDEISEEKPVLGVDTAAQRTIAYLACRSAVKAGDYLTQDQRQQLLTKLANTPHHQTCPHGRPTQIMFSLNELERMFRRKK